MVSPVYVVSHIKQRQNTAVLPTIRPPVVRPAQSSQIMSLHWRIFLKILFIFRKRGREGEREGEKHQCVVASHTPPAGDLAHNLGMCPD